MRKLQSKKSLTLTPLTNELLIYDNESGQVHHLNEAATQVFQACRDGLEVADSNEQRAALEELLEKGLLTSSQHHLRTRREALGLLGKVAAAPAVLSLCLPEPVAAQSGPVVFASAGTFMQTVPMGATMVQVTARGADGGRGGSGLTSGQPTGIGALGAQTNTTVPVTAGNTLTIVVPTGGVTGGNSTGSGIVGLGGTGGSGSPAGANGNPGALDPPGPPSFPGGGGGGAGGTASVSGSTFATILASGGTGGGGSAGGGPGPPGAGQSGTLGGQGGMATTTFGGDGGNGGLGATGTGDGPLVAGSGEVTLAFS